MAPQTASVARREIALTQTGVPRRLVDKGVGALLNLMQTAALMPGNRHALSLPSSLGQLISRGRLTASLPFNDQGDAASMSDGGHPPAGR